MHALIVGAGDTGTRIAREGLTRGWTVTGLTRSRAGAERVDETGAQTLIADLDDTTIPALPPADLLFYCAPPPRTGDDDPRLAGVLAAVPPDTVHRLVYIGTSGVYGDCGGEWVNEDRPLNPESDRARRRAAAEARIAAWGGDYAILRAPGIYGPGRLPIDRIREGQPIVADAEGPWTNRIHVDDLADIALAAAERGPARAIYNAADGNPTPMGVYYRALAERLAAPPPPEVDWATAEHTFNTMRLSFLRESRRLSIQRLLESLGISLRYPDFETGLDASLV